MSKKTESIEVRLSPELKSALARVSDGNNRTMSNTVRHLIEGEVAGRIPHSIPGETVMLSTTYKNFIRAAALALPVFALAFVYLMSAQSTASASAEIRTFFAAVDADGDNHITAPEIEAFASADGWRAEPDCAAMSEPCTIPALATQQLARADVDSSGAVSFAEFEAIMLRDRAEDFLDTDLDENGTLTLDEFVGAELHWLAQDPDAMAEEDITLSAACLAQLDAEQVHGIAEVCGFTAQGRIEIAQYDADHSGTVTLMEYLSY